MPHSRASQLPFLALFAIPGVLFGLSCAKPAAVPPSIVFLLIDTLRADYLGSYGFDGPVSPHLDGLAGESVLFERCVSAAPWTMPSVASLFTSLNPGAHGVTNHDGNMWGGEEPDLVKGVLREDALTLAEVLHERGYRTAAFVANPWMTREYGFGQGFDVYDDSRLRAPADSLIAAAERWLAREPERPCFLYLHFMEVHAPYSAPAGAHERVRGCPGTRSDVVLPPEHWPRVPRSILQSRWVEEVRKAGDPEAAVRLQSWKEWYAAGVRDLDDRVGPFLDRLRESGLLDRAYLVATSDHGEELYDHGSWEHGYTLYEEQLHVPLLIRPPGGVSGPRRVPATVGLIDLFPTLARAAGAPPLPVEGKSLAPFLDGSGEGGSGIVLSTASRTRPGLVAVHAGPYELIEDRAEGKLALYDVGRDPGETENLAGDRPEVVERLRSYLAGLAAAGSRAALFEPRGDAVSEETREILRSLGYVH